MLIHQIEEFLSYRIIQILISGFAAAFISVTAIPVIITISRLKNLMDVPGDRSSHVKKTPTLGGVAIFASILVSYFLWENPDGGSLIHLSLAALVTLFFLGLKDDILVLSPKKKIFGQLAASVLVIVGSDLRLNHFFGIFGIHEIPYLISIGLTMFVFIALINAFNLIDGIDGLAGGIATIACGFFGIWFYLNGHYALACLASATVGGLIGFLRFNFSKKHKIFMGDTGSMILGYLLTMFAVKFIQLNVTYIIDPNAYFSAPIMCIVVMIVPVFDTLRVFMIRLKNQQSPFVGDRNHLHHLLIDAGLSHPQASLVLYTFTLLSIGLFLSIDQYISNTQSFFVLAGFFILYMLACNSLRKYNGTRARRLGQDDNFNGASNGNMTKSFSEMLIEKFSLPKNS
jgi:UDP-GlcNAc:undecaprenyl-phosphate/decaprenyl-phosphate GlcNAc-1-phosphate transferase